MNAKHGANMEARIWRRIVVKSAVFAVWAAGMLAIVLQGGQELVPQAYCCMLFAIVAAWVVSTVRDARRLRRMNAID